MKTFSLAGVFLLLVLSTIGQATTVYEKPTQRMQQIEAKFGIKLVCILDDQQGDQRWVFVAESADRIFHLVPVVVPKDATDRDVMIAREASENCATFYEEMLKNAPDKPASFNMPTHPSLCILMPTHPPDGFCDQTLSQ